MDNKILLQKMIALLYRESQIANLEENSSELIKTALCTVKQNKSIPDIGYERTKLDGLKSLVLEMIENPVHYTYDQDVLLSTLKVICDEDEKLYESLHDLISKPLTDGGLKTSVLNLQKSIQNAYKTQSISDILSKADYEFKFKRDTINVNEFLSGLQGQLEALQLSSTSKDPAIMGRVSFSDRTSVVQAFTEAEDMVNGDGILKLGYKCLNIMYQGGLRRGQFMQVSALKFNYKTGFTLGIFKQVALYNKPHMLDQEKKPLLLYLLFEDELPNRTQFLYESLKFTETREPVDMTNVSKEEMSDYVMDRLKINGYHVEMIRVNPSLWTYRNILSTVIEFESQGYEIHLLAIDYLALLPTTGCVTSGPMGTDKRDMFSRVRNFCAAKKIAVITPHQLSSEAGGLLRGGLPEHSFVKEVANRDFYEGSKQLSQGFDLGTVIHVFQHDGEYYLSMHREKHRGVAILPDKDKFFMMKFPPKSPIPDDINDEGETYWRSLKELPGSNGAGLLDF